jgi:hypothetical protein
MAFAANQGQPLFSQGMFSVDPNSTPDQIATRRALMAALRPRYGSAKYVGEGLGQLATGLVEGRQNRQMRDIEGEGRQQADALFAGLLGGATGGERAASGQQPLNILGPNPSYGSDAEQIGADTMAAIGRPSNAGGYRESLIGTESGGNFGARNNEVGAGGQRGHFGRVQFGQARLQDAMNAGAIPQGTTPEAFMASPELQMAAENWHFADLESKLAPYVGTVVNGQPLDMGALVAMGHLGGAEGARRFVESGGQYNPSDSFGTSLADYAQTHGGQGGGAARNPVTPQIPADQLIAAMTTPWLSAEQRGMLQTIYDQQVSQNDPMAAIELDRAQLELEALRNPQAKPQEPIEVGGVLLDPVTREVIFDSRSPEGSDPRYQPVGGQIWDMQPEGGGPPTLVGGGSEEVIYGPDGTPIVTRGPAGSTRPFTEAQSKDVVFATRAQGALDVLDPVANKLTERLDIAAGYVPFGLGKGLQDADYQVARQAADEFLQAILRKDTGAAITEQEQVLYGVTYLPQPGDGPDVLQAKAGARKRAIAAIEAGMSASQIIAQERALGSGDAPPPANGAGQTLTYNPETGDFE